MTKLEEVKENVRKAQNELVQAVLGLEMVMGIIFKDTINEMKQTIGDLVVTEHVLELHIEAHCAGKGQGNNIKSNRG